MQHTPPIPQDDRLDAALEALYRVDVPASFQSKWQNAILGEEQPSMKQTSSRSRFSSHFLRRGLLPAAAALVLVVGALWVGGQDLSPASKPQNSAVSRSKSSASYSAREDSYDSAAITSEADYGMSAGGAYENGNGLFAAAAPGGESAQPLAADSRKLVRTADITLRTAAFDEDAQAVEELLAGVGGYVESSYQSGDAQNGDTRALNLRLRVPSDQLDAFLSGVSGVGRVVNQSQTTTDMTVQYADNEARLATLRDKLARLRELMAKAEAVADIVEIENAIADAQYQIDSYETSQRTIDRSANMSEVGLRLVEDDPVAVTSDMGMAERLKAALAVSVEGLARFARNLLVFFVMALPVLIPAAVLWIVLRAWLRRKKAKGQAPANPKEES